ncbi:MAG: GFA family protein [Novosphingobium sp.]
MAYTGRCACGAITLEINAEPIATRQCWCRQCQQISSGGPSHNAIFPAGSVAVTGQLAQSSWRAASGNTLTHTHCPACGTQIYAQSSARPQLKTVRFGVIDEPHGLRPEAAIWTEDAPDWALIDPALEQFAQQPPPPPPTA